MALEGEGAGKGEAEEEEGEWDLGFGELVWWEVEVVELRCTFIYLHFLLQLFDGMFF